MFHVIGEIKLTDKKLTELLARTEREKRRIKKLPRLIGRAVKKYRKKLTQDRMREDGSYSRTWGLEDAKRQVQYLTEQYERREEGLRDVQARLVTYRVERDARRALQALKDVKRKKKKIENPNFGRIY